jgi:hypothetical protein
MRGYGYFSSERWLCVCGAVGAMGLMNRTVRPTTNPAIIPIQNRGMPAFFQVDFRMATF